MATRLPLVGEGFRQFCFLVSRPAQNVSGQKTLPIKNYYRSQRVLDDVLQKTCRVIDMMVPSRAPLDDNAKIIYESRVLLGLLSVGCIILALAGLLMFGVTIGLFLGLLGPMKPGDVPYIAFGMLL